MTKLMKKTMPDEWTYVMKKERIRPLYDIYSWQHKLLSGHYYYNDDINVLEKFDLLRLAKKYEKASNVRERNYVFRKLNDILTDEDWEIEKQNVKMIKNLPS